VSDRTYDEAVGDADLERCLATWRFRYAIWLGVIVTSSQPFSPASLRTSTASVLRGRSLRSTVRYSHSGIAPRAQKSESRDDVQA
jgi:hypothetical protein